MRTARVKKIWIVIGVIALVAGFGFEGMTFAQPPMPPCVVIGTAYLNGAPVAEGTVAVSIGGEEVASTTTGADGSLYVQVTGNYSSQEMAFTVNDVEAQETATWKMGITVEKDLHATNLPPVTGIFASSIENFTPGDPVYEKAPINNILGPPDKGKWPDVLGSIGHNGQVIVDFESNITDGPGDDIEFWFGGFDDAIETMEGFRVEGSQDGKNFEQIAEIPRGETLSPPVPLTSVGVDLAGTGVTKVKFLKIIDTGTDHAGKGLELNAIEKKEPKLTGDVNKDGKVDAADLALVAAAFNTKPSSNPAADLNHDGIVDIYDLVIVGKNFSKKQ